MGDKLANVPHKQVEKEQEEDVDDALAARLNNLKR